MRFTEHELTAAVTGAAKAVLATQRKDVRKGKTDIDTAWQEMDAYQRFKLLDGLGDQLLPVLIALPDVAVQPGARPTYSDREVSETVESVLGEGGPGKLRRAVIVKARTALVQTALGHVPPRQDPDALLGPDHP